ncbi:hypothetical protein Sjap_022981 [Stephania japonica]|uniref:Uncharacterized protein n=1 Tax=Stephania japonica TaxID=461633 RepID=A0AAP0HTL6_9MAGN
MDLFYSFESKENLEIHFQLAFSIFMNFANFWVFLMKMIYKFLNWKICLFVNFEVIFEFLVEFHLR